MMFALPWPCWHVRLKRIMAQLQRDNCTSGNHDPVLDVEHTTCGICFSAFSGNRVVVLYY